MKKTKVKSLDKYTPAKHKSRGIIRNVDETGTDEVFYVGKSYGVDMVIFICEFQEFEGISNQEPGISTESNVVSEDFALKMLSISTGNERFKDLK